MKILLTGPPKSGKTTLLVNLIADIHPKHGMVAKEVLEDDKRVGFDLVDEHEHEATLSRVGKHTDYPVGCYFVDVDSFDDYIDRLSPITSDQLLYIDEIGQMQLYSKKFETLANTYLNSSCDYIGTVSAVFAHPFIDAVKTRPDVLLCSVTPENRQMLGTVLSEALANRNLFNSLPTEQQSTLLGLARHYLQTKQYISLKKLFHNALKYISEHKVMRVGDNAFSVEGKHGCHLVNKVGQNYQCDCDFFNGRGQFKDRSGECSHIQTAKILFSDPNNPWKTLNSHVIHQSRWLTLYEDEVIMPNGKPGLYTYAKSPPFVLVVAYDGSQFIMVRQYRYPLGQVMTEFPGGSIDGSEEPLAAAKREFEEETGLRAQKWTRLGIIHNPNLATVFLAEELSDTGHDEMEEDGIANIVRITDEQIDHIIANEELTDSKTLAALTLFERYRSRL